jgi:hypothetical protein
VSNWGCLTYDVGMGTNGDKLEAHLFLRGAQTTEEAMLWFLMNQMSLKGRASRAIDPRKQKTWKTLENRDIRFDRLCAKGNSCIPTKLQEPNELESAAYMEALGADARWPDENLDDE